MENKSEYLKMISEYLEMVESVVQDAEKYKPIAEMIVKTVKMFVPEIKELFSMAALGYVDLRIQSIRKYERNEFTRDEAIMMTCDDFMGVKRAIQQSQNKRGS